MKQLTRRELYDLVWSKPMTKLAKEFSLSDVALHKTCRRHRIPTPGLGYWAKVAAGTLGDYDRHAARGDCRLALEECGF